MITPKQSLLLQLAACAGILGAAFACTGPSSDGVAPTVEFLKPLAGDTVSGTVELLVEAEDNDAVVSVAILVDGDTLTVDPSKPFEALWSTASLSDGSTHLLRAVARDPGGNLGIHQIAVVVRVPPG